MPKFILTTRVAASVERCFDLARDIDFHLRSMSTTGERAVDGRTSGLIDLGETVTWEARHFGVRWQMTSRIAAMERPVYFRDEMVAGPFAAFGHDHRFESDDGATLMTDVVEFRSPWGVVGRAVDALVMARYLRHLIERRNRTLKREAEMGSRQLH